MTCLTIPEDGSLVRVFHAVPNAPAVDVYVNDSLAFRNISFRQFTNYVPLSAGQYIVKLYATGTTGPELLSSELSIPLGGIFTTAASGNINDLQLLVLEDYDATGPSDMESKFRVVHLAPNTPAINLSLDGIPMIQGIHFREMTSFAAVPPNAYIVTAFHARNNTRVLTFRVQLQAGYLSTIYIVGEPVSLAALQSVDGGTYLCNPNE